MKWVRRVFAGIAPRIVTVGGGLSGDQGIKATTSPSRSGPAVATRATQARYIARETAAYLYYEIFRRSADFQAPAT